MTKTKKNYSLLKWATPTPEAKAKKKPKEPTYFQNLVMIDERFIGWLYHYFGSCPLPRKELEGAPFLLVSTGTFGDVTGFKKEKDAYKYLNKLPTYKVSAFEGAMLFDVEAGTSKTIKVKVSTSAVVS